MRFALVLAGLLTAYGLVAPPWWAYVPLNLAIAAGLIVIARRRGHSFDDLGMDTTTLTRGVAIGLAVAGVVVVAVGLGSQLLGSDPEAGRAMADRGGRNFLPGGLAYETLVRIPLGTALFEAVAFRGVIFAAVKRSRSLAVAVVVSSVAFGVWHIGPTLHALSLTGGGEALAHPALIVAGTVAVTAVGGAVFTWLRLLGRSLVTPALAHWSLNAAGLLAAYTAAGGSLPF